MQTKILEEIMAVVKVKGIKAPKKDMITYVGVYQAVDITNPLCCNILKRAAQRRSTHLMGRWYRKQKL